MVATVRHSSWPLYAGFFATSVARYSVIMLFVCNEAIALCDRQPTNFFFPLCVYCRMGEKFQLVYQIPTGTLQCHTHSVLVLTTKGDSDLETGSTNGKTLIPTKILHTRFLLKNCSKLFTLSRAVKS